MVSVSTTAALPLLPILQRAFPDVTSYQIDKNIVQSNAEGFCLTAFSNSDDACGNSNDTKPSTRSKSNEAFTNSSPSLVRRDLFVKCVEATKYSSRPWADLRRTLLYSRTEARFYSDVLPLLQQQVIDNNNPWTIAPKCYLADSSLEDLIDEKESTSAKQVKSNNDDNHDHTVPKYDENNISILQNKGGNLILQSLNQSYYQTSPLSISQAKECVSAVAKFHACAFQKQDILHIVSQKLCQYGGSYHLQNRNPKELANMKDTWGEIVMNLKKDNEKKEVNDLPDGFLDREGIRNLGERIYNVAEYVSMELSPAFDDDHATIVHGDYKAMNVFLPLPQEKKNDDDDAHHNNSEPLLIDFASVGVGLGVSDIAMHIPHAVHPSDLENGGEEELVEHYYTIFQQALSSQQRRGGNEGEATSYTKEQFWRHYKFARVDYFRFILGRMWKGLSMDVFEKRKNLKNFAEFNRTLKAAIAFIVRVDLYLVEIEAEMKEKKM